MMAVNQVKAAIRNSQTPKPSKTKKKKPGPRSFKLIERKLTYRKFVEFPEMKGVQPAEGEQASPEAVDQAERVLPIVKALVALSAARVQSGLAPGERIVIEVRPSAVHPQDELRHT